ncbi:hypothetical protein HanIR_Chr16g0801501 [Helianthus annuus]|nr:hypothetical protein HanIR_Chr16g0801501 [Helianthus annuus]
MSASRRHTQIVGSCSLFVFLKSFSPKTSSPPLPQADMNPSLQTSSLFHSTQTTTSSSLCITFTTHLRHHLHHHISATTYTTTSPPPPPPPQRVR